MRNINLFTETTTFNATNPEIFMISDAFNVTSSFASTDTTASHKTTATIVESASESLTTEINLYTAQQITTPMTRRLFSQRMEQAL